MIALFFDGRGEGTTGGSTLRFGIGNAAGREAGTGLGGGVLVLGDPAAGDDLPEDAPWSLASLFRRIWGGGRASQISLVYPACDKRLDGVRDRHRPAVCLYYHSW